LFGGLQIALVLGFFSHALHGIHHVLLLSQEGVAQIGGPLDVICKSFDDIGKTGHGLDARIPRLLRHCIGQRLIF